jgi:hypothetical protein
VGDAAFIAVEALVHPEASAMVQHAEATEREERYRREWAAINEALRDNSMAVMRRCR